VRGISSVSSATRAVHEARPHLSLDTCEGNHASGRPRFPMQAALWLLRTVAAAYWLSQAAAFSSPATPCSHWLLRTGTCQPAACTRRPSRIRAPPPPAACVHAVHMRSAAACAPLHMHCRRTCTAAACAHAFCRRTCTCALPPLAQPRGCELRAEIASAAQREKSPEAPSDLLSPGMQIGARCELEWRPAARPAELSRSVPPVG